MGIRCCSATVALVATASVSLSFGVLWSSQKAANGDPVDAIGRSEQDQDGDVGTSRLLANFDSQVAYYSDPKSVEVIDREVSIETESLVLPNVLMIGAMKASTTSVSDLLYSNGVCDADIFPGEPGFYHKEVHFFDIRYEKGIDFYMRRFEHCRGKKFVMDATPAYFTYPDEAYNTYVTMPERFANLKIMAILREPISREQSMYKHIVRDASMNLGYLPKPLHDDILFENRTIMSFEQYAEAVLASRLNEPDLEHIYRKGVYVDYLRRWSELFGREKILLLSYDELKNNPAKIIQRVEAFLGISLKGKMKHSNSQHITKYESIAGVTQRVVEVLGPIFGPKNEELYSFLEGCNGPPMEQCPFPCFKEVAVID